MESQIRTQTELNSGPRRLDSLDSVLLWIGALGTGGALVGLAEAHDLPWRVPELALSWLLATLPLVYVARGRTLPALASALYFAFVALYTLGDVTQDEAWEQTRFLPVLALTSGLALFQIGGLHYAFPALNTVGRTVRLAGLGVGLTGLYALPFEAFSFEDSAGAIASVDGLMGVLIGLSAMGALLVLINQGVRCVATTRLTRSEAPISLVLFGLVTAYVLLPMPWVITAVLFNLATVLLCLAVVWVSMWRDDGLVYYIVAPCLLALLVGWYMDLVWENVAPTIGGIGLVVLLGISALVLSTARLTALRSSPSGE